MMRKKKAFVQIFGYWSFIGENHVIKSAIFTHEIMISYFQCFIPFEPRLHAL